MSTLAHPRTRTGRIGGALAVCATAIALWPAGALGSTVDISGTTLSYSGAQGEANDVAVSRPTSDEFEIVDRGTAITAPSICDADPADEGHRVQCPSEGIEILDLRLGDLNDKLSVADLGLADTPFGSPPVQVSGEAGNDSLSGLDGDEEMWGGAGADVVSGGGGADSVDGGLSTFISEEGIDGGDVVDGGPGDDRAVRGGPGDDRVSGGSGDDPVVAGGEGADDVAGGPGDDEVVGGAGDDRVRGGAGADRLDVPSPSLNNEVDSREERGRDRIEGGGGDDLLGIEGPDAVAADVLSGGDGVDSVSYAGRANSLRVSLDGQANDGEPDEGDNVAADVEEITGGSESDTLIGSAGEETIDGGPGDDLIDGLAGNDRLAGGVNDSGSDTLLGGAGVDEMLGGPGDDSLEGGDDRDEARGGGGSDTVAGDGGDDALVGGPGLDSIEGGPGNDTLRGGDMVLIGADGADHLDGGVGDDALFAGPGNDVLDGGLGADVISGEAGRDTVTYETRSGRVSVTFDSMPNDGERGENDNVASDVERVIGSGAADTLTGDGRSNALTGGSGEDLLAGRGGADVLSGGTAPDVLNARDGLPDTVDCGPGRDLAIVDRRDSSRNCEFRALPGVRRPALRRSMRVATARSGPAFRLPRARRYVRLPGALELPLGTTIDARSARVRVTTGRNRRRTQTAEFAQGAFSVRQTRGRRPLTDIRLRGGDFSVCARAATAHASQRRKRAKKTVRRVWGKGRGNFRASGQHSAGVVRGTTWVTADRCDGTLTRVITGTVVVRDFTLDRTVVVRAGERYLARAPRGR